MRKYDLPQEGERFSIVFFALGLRRIRGGPRFCMLHQPAARQQSRPMEASSGPVLQGSTYEANLSARENFSPNGLVVGLFSLSLQKKTQGLSKSTKDLPISPAALMAPVGEEGGGAALGVEDMADDMQVT